MNNRNSLQNEAKFALVILRQTISLAEYHVLMVGIHGLHSEQYCNDIVARIKD